MFPRFIKHFMIGAVNCVNTVNTYKTSKINFGSIFNKNFYNIQKSTLAGKEQCTGSCLENKGACNE